MTPDSIVFYGDAAPSGASAIRTAAFDEARARLREASALVVVLPTPRWITTTTVQEVDEALPCATKRRGARGQPTSCWGLVPPAPPPVSC